MTNLTGTEKQVAWASEIRAAKLAEAESIKRPGASPEALAKGNALIAKLAAQDSAEYWINNRHETARTMLQDLMRSGR